MKAREKPSFTFGIEEEYFLVDPRTRALVSEPPKSVLDECKADLAGHVSAETITDRGRNKDLHTRVRRP